MRLIKNHDIASNRVHKIKVFIANRPKNKRKDNRFRAVDSFLVWLWSMTWTAQYILKWLQCPRVVRLRSLKFPSCIMSPHRYMAVVITDSESIKKTVHKTWQNNNGRKNVKIAGWCHVCLLCLAQFYRFVWWLFCGFTPNDPNLLYAVRLVAGAQIPKGMKQRITFRGCCNNRHVIVLFIHATGIQNQMRSAVLIRMDWNYHRNEFMSKDFQSLSECWNAKHNLD